MEVCKCRSLVSFSFLLRLVGASELEKCCSYAEPNIPLGVLFQGLD